jgi:hypothetical protein
LPHRGARTPEGLFTFDQMRGPRAHGFAAAADFIQMGSLDRRIRFACKTCEKLFDQLGPTGTRQTKSVYSNFFDGESHGEQDVMWCVKIKALVGRRGARDATGR